MKSSEVVYREILAKQRTGSTVAITFLFTVAILFLGYISFGIWTMLIFTSGFLGGFILWLAFPSRASFSSFSLPYWLSLLFFAFHRMEEKFFGFFDFLANVTNFPTPKATSWSVLTLVGLSAGAWLAIPWLTKRQIDFGYYLAWTFFSAMGITELAHWFIFPFFAERFLSYVPGMMSVIFLAPLSWWGLSRLYLGSSDPREF